MQILKLAYSYHYQMSPYKFQRSCYSDSSGIILASRYFARQPCCNYRFFLKRCLYESSAWTYISNIHAPTYLRTASSMVRLGPTQCPIQMVLSALFSGVKRSEPEAASNTFVQCRSYKCVKLYLHYPIHVCVWCLIKHRTLPSLNNSLVNVQPLEFILHGREVPGMHSNSWKLCAQGENIS